MGEFDAMLRPAGAGSAAVADAGAADGAFSHDPSADAARGAEPLPATVAHRPQESLLQKTAHLGTVLIFSAGGAALGSRGGPIGFALGAGAGAAAGEAVYERFAYGEVHGGKVLATGATTALLVGAVVCAPTVTVMTRLPGLLGITNPLAASMAVGGATGGAVGLMATPVHALATLATGDAKGALQEIGNLDNWLLNTGAGLTLGALAPLVSQAARSFFAVPEGEVTPLSKGNGGTGAAEEGTGASGTEEPFTELPRMSEAEEAKFWHQARVKHHAREEQVMRQQATPEQLAVLEGAESYLETLDPGSAGVLRQVNRNGWQIERRTSIPGPERVVIAGPQTKLYRWVEPEFLNTREGTVGGNPHSMALIEDHGNLPPPRYEGVPAEAPERNASELGPGLNVTTASSGNWGASGLVKISIRLGDVMKAAGKVFHDVGTQDSSSLYVTFQGEIPYELESVAGNLPTSDASTATGAGPVNPSDAE